MVGSVVVNVTFFLMCAGAGAGIAWCILARYATVPYLFWYLRMRHARHRLLRPGAAGVGGGRRVVVSLSAIPSRLPGIRATLNSLLAQSRAPDCIYLNIPHRSRREQRGYRLPPDIVNDPRIVVQRWPVDLGPILKLLPTLDRETDPATLIVTVDDDAVYPRHLLRTLLDHHARLPAAALGFRGWRVPRCGRFLARRVRYANQVDRPWRVHVLSGVCGVLYRRDLFGPDFMDRRGMPAEAFFVDDICISGYLEARGVARYLIPYPMREPFARYLLTVRTNPLWRINRDGHNDQVMVNRYFGHCYARPREDC
ncbi:MAG: hypothetical protein ABIL58_15580 [Pseudomonadota bacterium]